MNLYRATPCLAAIGLALNLFVLTYPPTREPLLPIVSFIGMVCCAFVLLVHYRALIARAVRDMGNRVADLLES